MLTVFKTVERRVRPVSGVFDSHTLPPFLRFAAMRIAALQFVALRFAALWIAAL